MRILLGFICLILCTGVGFYLSKKYVTRREFFCEFFEFNKDIRNEISFSQTSILSLIEKKTKKKNLFCNNINDYFIYKKKPNLDKNVFSSEEINFFNGYLNSLGSFDRNTQINQLEKIDKQLTDITEKAKEEEKKYKSLYVKMGFLIGLIALVVIL